MKKLTAGQASSEKALRITGPSGFDFTAVLVYEGDRYGLNNSQQHDSPLPLIELYDARYSNTEHGQFVNRYYLSTFLAIDGVGLNLNGGVRDWWLGNEHVASVQTWARELTGLTVAREKVANEALLHYEFGGRFEAVMFQDWEADLQGTWIRSGIIDTPEGAARTKLVVRFEADSDVPVEIQAFQNGRKIGKRNSIVQADLEQQPAPAGPTF
jgi:hypothetical protein